MLCLVLLQPLCFRAAGPVDCAVSCLQSLALANLFVWLEFLFFFGYRKDLQARLNARIEAERAQANSLNGQTAPLLADQNKQ